MNPVSESGSALISAPSGSLWRKRHSDCCPTGSLDQNRLKQSEPMQKTKRHVPVTHAERERAFTGSFLKPRHVTDSRGGNTSPTTRESFQAHPASLRQHQQFPPLNAALQRTHGKLRRQGTVRHVAV